MSDTILSAGIDIGTSTTQLVFSRLTIQNVSGFGDIPRIEIVNKEIIYRSDIYFTPLLSENEIDAEAVKTIIISEYMKAKIKPGDLSTGAIIITGETSRKRNAKEVLHALSGIAGDFVVATAGPDLEAVLAGKGSGAAALSKETGKLVANMDIGGGTTNICYFQDGQVVDTACLDIGGRLIKISKGRIIYLSSKIKQLLEYLNISVNLGDCIENGENECLNKLYYLAVQMVHILEQSVGLRPPTELLELMKTNRLISSDKVPDIITISGGVADCIHRKYEDEFIFGDIGVILGEAVSNSKLLYEKMHEHAKETMNATVIGAGNFSMEVSGSTIEYQNCKFPYKNIPVVEFEINEQKYEVLGSEIKKVISRYQEEEEKDTMIALATKGIKCPSYSNIESIATEIIDALEDRINKGMPLILVFEEDMGKALGQALKRALPRSQSLLCIDRILCHNGDYIDVGAPIASGKVVPVVVKTLVFNS
jgi:ethanolamine utilization protein EutA